MAESGMATLPIELKPFADFASTEHRFFTQCEYRVTDSALTRVSEQGFRFWFEATADRVVLKSAFVPDWFEPTIIGFLGIKGLSHDWNSYGGKPVNRDLINGALFVLGQIMQANSPAPSVVPMGDGGIQIEWHRKQQDLEILFPADEAPQFRYVNRATGLEFEGFANETPTLTQLLINLT